MCKALQSRGYTVVSGRCTNLQIYFGLRQVLYRLGDFGDILWPRVGTVQTRIYWGYTVVSGRHCTDVGIYCDLRHCTDQDILGVYCGLRQALYRRGDILVSHYWLGYILLSRVGTVQSWDILSQALLSRGYTGLCHYFLGDIQVSDISGQGIYCGLRQVLYRLGDILVSARHRLGGYTGLGHDQLGDILVAGMTGQGIYCGLRQHGSHATGNSGKTVEFTNISPGWLIITEIWEIVIENWNKQRNVFLRFCER